MRRRLHILLLCHFEPNSAGTIIEHIDAFKRWSSHRYYILNNLGDLPWWIDLARFDAVVVHYSLVASYDNYLSPATRERIRAFSGFKAGFVQDDYRWINDTINAYAYMRINALFGLAGPDIIDQVYPPARLPGVRRETVLTGYVPEALTQRTVLPMAKRPIDVGYRARKLPAWIGSHTLQKWQIADRFLADARRYGLVTDISYREEDRIYGENWIRFVSNCKAVLGTESGASVCDFTGDIQRNVEAHLKRDPDASFETLRDLYFKDVDGKIPMNVISPRCFEAAALRTLMILYEGHYSGILKPWRHYVPLRMDHSNMDEVAALLRRPADAQAIIDQAYNEIALNPAYTFRAFVKRVDQIIETDYQPTEPRDGYSDEEFTWRLSPNRNDLSRYATVVAAAQGAGAHRLFRKRGEPPLVLPETTTPGSFRGEFAMAPPLKISAVHLVWSATASDHRGTVELFWDQRRIRQFTFNLAARTRYMKIQTTVTRPVDRMVIAIEGADQRNSLHLEDIRIDGELHFAEKLRQAKERMQTLIATRSRYAISEAWMSLPEWLRKRIKRPVRRIYNAIVGIRN